MKTRFFTWFFLLAVTVIVNAQTTETPDPFIYKIGDKITSDKFSVNFNKVDKMSIVVDTVDIKNVSTEKLKLGIGRIPVHISVVFKPITLKPGKTGQMIVTYDATKTRPEDFGYISDYFNIIFNDQPDDNMNRVNVHCTLFEDFSKYTPQQLEMAPAISFENETYDYGKVKQGEMVNFSFVFKNNGKTDLVIRSTRGSCGCTVTKPEKNIIKPGETSNISATFNSAGRRGRQDKSITVVTNDPKKSEITLWLKGEVLEPETTPEPQQ